MKFVNFCAQKSPIPANGWCCVVNSDAVRQEKCRDVCDDGGNVSKKHRCYF